MPINDPIGDMVTRIRNAGRAGHEKVTLPLSRIKEALAKVLKDEGYLKDYLVHKTGPQGELTVILKYGPDREPVIQEIKRVSKPGLRRYVGKDGIRPIRGGLGVSILSTSKGLLADREARKQNLGGEVLCTVA